MRSRDLGLLWFTLLIMAICFEGLGRAYLTFIPSVVFYFAKDIVLVAGALFFGVHRSVIRRGTSLLGIFVFVWIAAVAWTVLQTLNPNHVGPQFAVLGLRAYWFWWFAPFVIASALRDTPMTKVTTLLGFVTILIAVLAFVQFLSPTDSLVNANASYDGELMRVTDRVRATNRARVSSTFAFLSGFNDFEVIAIPLLLGLGIATRGHVRWIALAGFALAVTALPMSGSRGPLVQVGVQVLIILVSVGAIATRLGRRAIIALALAAGLSLAFSGEAIEGVRSRFAGADTAGRFEKALTLLPPYALVWHRYPLLGEGTGMQQNARFALGGTAEYYHEGEQGRILIEQGAPGYLLIWLTRLGLIWALVRAGLLLKRRGYGSVAGIAMSLAATCFLGNLIFDHVYNALFFMAVGVVLTCLKRTDIETASGQAS